MCNAGAMTELHSFKIKLGILSGPADLLVDNLQLFNTFIIPSVEKYRSPICG